MKANNYYDQRKYKTEKGIETFHEVKYEKLETPELFDKALNELDLPIYSSVIAERARTAYYKKTIKIYGTSQTKNETFKKLCNSFLKSISPEVDIDLVEKNVYQKLHENVHKFIYMEGERFISTWIHKDVIYRDEFRILNSDKAVSKILIMKSMKTPFELSRTSLNSTTIRIQFRKGWKLYLNEIKKGIM